MTSECPANDIFVPSVGFCRPSSQFTCDDTVSGSDNTGLCTNKQKYGAYPDNCAAFVECATNKVLRCMDGYLFDVAKSICQPASLATCYEGSGDSIPQYVYLECATLPLGSFISHRDCSKYYICAGSSVRVASCPNGKHFSRAFNGCVNILSAGCRALGSVCVGQAVGYTFPALQCPQYYSCPASGFPALNNCASGSVYNPTAEKCVSSSEYNCSDDIIVPGATTSNPPTTSTTTTTSKTTTTTTPRTTTTTLPPFNPNDQCSVTKSGTKISDPSDCTKYYLCNNGSAISLECYSGQYFSVSSQLCSSSNPSC